MKEKPLVTTTELVLSAHMKGRIHTLEILESIASNYNHCTGPDAIRQSVKLVRDVVLKQAEAEGIKL